MLVIFEPNTKLHIRRTDGEKITISEFRELEQKIWKEQGGPSHATWRLRLDHWDEISPITIVPDRMEFTDGDNHTVWIDLRSVADTCEKMKMNLFGICILQERSGDALFDIKFFRMAMKPDEWGVQTGKMEWITFDD